MIHYNSPEHQKERANVVPLSMDEIQELVKYVNDNHKTGLFENVIQRFIYDYENLSHIRETMQVWISVNDRLPETEIEVLSYCGKYKNIFTCVLTQEWGWTENSDDMIKIFPTHWMPLPEKPTI